MPNFDAEREVELRQARNRLAEIFGTVYSHRLPLADLRYRVTGRGKGPEPIPASGWKPFKRMARWGGLDQSTWFAMTATLPKAYQGQRVVAMVDPFAHTDIPGRDRHDESGEGLAYVNGTPAQGIDRNHHVIVLTEKARPGQTFEIAIECTPQTRFDATHVFRTADMAVMHKLPWDFYWDATVYLDVIETMERSSETARRLLNLVTETVKRVDLQHAGEAAYFDSLARARRRLQRGMKAFEAGNDLGRLTLVGQSHIDTAWLWPLRETRRKVGRTWSTALTLMEQYPEYIFQASQPALYRFAKENHPALWKAIKKRVKEGRWEPCGATWVEQDNNIPSGESLVRQFLYGNQFYQREFGLRSRTAWLPDAFGFPWSFPQIMKRSGIETFFTIKISWSQFTDFPYSYFQWQGIDGTRIVALMPPMNYNGNPVPADAIRQRADFKQKELVDETPFPIGYGDGGGGATAEMLEYARRLRNVAGVPKCAFGKTEACFERMHAQVDGGAALPVYNGELYLELHRGCQTTQARAKRNNRKTEILLHNAEFLGSMALLHSGAYDHKAMSDAWHIVLTNQFHDILPGSSISEVYQVAEEDYASARSYAAKALDASARYLARAIDTRGPGLPIIVFNTLSWPRSGVVQAQVCLPPGRFHVVAPYGTVVPSQRTGKDEILFEARAVPPLGYAVYRVIPGAAQAADPGTLTATERGLENDSLRIRLDASGRFTSVYDKLEGREVLAPGQKANVLQLFDDRPAANDAWDIDHNFEDTMWEPGKAEAIQVLETGPVRAVVRALRKTERSTIRQDITLYALGPRVDVVTHANWREKRALLKVAFPVDILSSHAAYAIQFGTIERPAHHNRDVDRARFEVPAQQWADLSEGDYGVSLMNDCKYGYDIRDNVMRLSLLRAPIEPDPSADEGEHDFVYAIYPHAGDWRNGTVQQAAELNNPLLAVTAKAGKGALPSVHAFASVDSENVIIDTVKKAEDGNGLIVRVYEAYGQRNKAAITFGHAPKNVSECNLMEEEEQPAKVKGNTLSLYIKPYEIRSFKISF